MSPADADPATTDALQAERERRQLDAAVSRVLSGDREAFAEIVMACQDRVWRVLALLLDHRSQTEELVQAAFVRAYDHLESYHLGTDLAAWIVTIARNLARNAARDANRERQRLQRFHQVLLSQGGALAPDDAEAGRDDDRLRAALAACRSQLAPDAQDALRLIYQEEYAIAAVATHLGRSQAATQKFLSRIRLSLRDCVMRRIGTPTALPHLGQP